MALVIPEGFGECKLIWSYSGKATNVSSTVGLNLLGSSTPQEAVDDLFASWHLTNSYCDAGNMQEQWTFLGVEGIFLHLGVLVGAASAHAPVVGTKTAQNIPVLNSSLLLQKRTTRIGRKFRGRMFLPILELDEGAVSPLGVITPTNFDIEADHIATATVAMLASTVAASCILHNDSTTPTDIDSFILQQKVVTQRRRLN